MQARRETQARTRNATDGEIGFELSKEFDSWLARLQTLARRKALRSAFDATPKELGRLAVGNQRGRG